MNGNFVYSNNNSSIALFGVEFWKRYAKKKLKFTFKGKTICLQAYFMSTIGIKEEKIEIEVNWTQNDLNIGASLLPLIDLTNLFDDCLN